MNDPQIERVAIDALIPYARNSRTHSDSQIAQIAASIREFGFTNPVLIDAQGGIIAGHGRLLAARKLNLTDVPCLRLSHLTDTQKRAYIIADNKLALNAGWDEELLRIEFEELADLDFDLELTGFSMEEISALDVDDLQQDEAGDGDEAQKGNLSDRFMIPPFSVMNAREGWWQNRKKAWLSLGIKSELGRGGGQEPQHTRQQSPVTQMEHSTTAGQPDRMSDSTASAKSKRGGADMGQFTADNQRRVKPLSGQAAPGGSARPACDYSNKQRGNGAGRAING